MSLTLHFHPLASYGHKVLIALCENDTPFTPNARRCNPTRNYLRNNFRRTCRCRKTRFVLRVSAGSRPAS
jgi:hypothetical protein